LILDYAFLPVYANAFVMCKRHEAGGVAISRLLRANERGRGMWQDLCGMNEQMLATVGMANGNRPERN